jgi:hypothetical protein
MSGFAPVLSGFAPAPTQFVAALDGLGVAALVFEHPHKQAP